MYCSQSKDGQGDFASIAIKDGRVEFRFDTGSGPAVLRSGIPINAGAWYTVSIERKLRDGRLKLSTGDIEESNENQEITGISTTVTGKSPGSTRGLNIRTSVYFGGIDEDNKYVVAEGVGVKQGFSGCIANIRIGGIRRSSVRGDGSVRGRNNGRGRNAPQRRKVLEVNLEQSVVDSSNVFDCSSLLASIVDTKNDSAHQAIKGIPDS